MTCSRCGSEAAVKRDSAFYCGKCAMARDWEAIIAVVQNDAIDRATISFDEPADTAPSPAAAPPPAAEAAPKPTPVATEVAPAPPSTPEPEPVEVAVAAAPAEVAADDLPADPFG